MNTTSTKIAGALGLITSLAATAQAGQCRQSAIIVARENSRNAAILQEVEHIRTSKAYLESYGVTFINSEGDPASIKSLVVTMMKNGCAVVSVVPRF